jgi:hypothetical protein
MLSYMTTSVKREGGRRERLQGRWCPLRVCAGSRSDALAWPEFSALDKIEITVDQKFGNNLAILHGSPKLDTNHPDAAGGRVMALYGPDGVLMIDSQGWRTGAEDD